MIKKLIENSWCQVKATRAYTSNPSENSRIHARNYLNKVSEAFEIIASLDNAMRMPNIDKADFHCIARPDIKIAGKELELWFEPDNEKPIYAKLKEEENDK